VATSNLGALNNALSVSQNTGNANYQGLASSASSGSLPKSTQLNFQGTSELKGLSFTNQPAQTGVPSNKENNTKKPHHLAPIVEITAQNYSSTTRASSGNQGPQPQLTYNNAINKPSLMQHHLQPQGGNQTTNQGRGREFGRELTNANSQSGNAQQVVKSLGGETANVISTGGTAA
jgi:hypothetical protein